LKNSCLKVLKDLKSLYALGPVWDCVKKLRALPMDYLFATLS
jgi:hypothetical protein